MVFFNLHIFITEIDDSVECFHCGGVLQNWFAGDDPIEEHAKFFPKCRFILSTQGKTYIRFAQFRYFMIKLREKQSTPQEITTADIASMQMFQYEDFLNLKKTVNRLVVGFTKVPDLHKRFFVQQYLRNFVFLTDCQKLFQYMTCMELLPRANTTIKNIRTKTTFLGSAVIENCTKASFSDNSLGNVQHSLPVLKAVPNLVGTFFSLKYNLFEDEGIFINFTCTLCCDKKIELAFAPCGHLISCFECYNKLTICPVCRSLIENTLRIFPSS